MERSDISLNQIHVSSKILTNRSANRWIRISRRCFVIYHVSKWW
jgi:hypothetical protein